MKNRHENYQSYSYLDAGTDYQEFDLAAERSEFPKYSFDLSASEEARVQRILAANIVVSLHDHPILLPVRPDEIHNYSRSARLRTGYSGLAQSCLDAVFDNVGIWPSESHSGWKWNDTIADLGMRLCDIAHQDFVTRAENVKDIRNAHESGRLAFVPALESASPIENELDRVDILYGLGIRQMGITYNESNFLGSGMNESTDGGLTGFGRHAVHRMNQVGMAIDLSHSGDNTALDVIAVSEQPVLITHAGSRTVWDTRRMKPDEVIVRCAEKGGLIGIEAAPHTTVSAAHPRHHIESVMDHFDYCVNLVGIDHVTFGPDTFFGDHVGLHGEMSAALGLQEVLFAKKELEPVDHVAGMENPAECFPNITRWLVKNNYSDDEIAAVIGGNALRVLTEIWGN